MIYNLIKPVEILESQRHMDGSEATLYFKKILGVVFRWKLGLLSPMLVEKTAWPPHPLSERILDPKKLEGAITLSLRFNFVSVFSCTLT